MLLHAWSPLTHILDTLCCYNVLSNECVQALIFGFFELNAVLDSGVRFVCAIILSELLYHQSDEGKEGILELPGPHFCPPFNLPKISPHNLEPLKLLQPNLVDMHHCELECRANSFGYYHLEGQGHNEGSSSRLPVILEDFRSRSRKKMCF